MTQSPDETPLPAGAEDATDILLPCRSCGYNVRGLPAESRGPACEAPISGLTPRKIPRIRKLEASDPGWLETLAGGMNWVLGGVVLMLIVGPLNLAIVLKTGALSYGVLLSLFAGMVICVGCWRITTREPGQVREDDPSARLLLRYGQMINLAVGFFAAQTLPTLPLWWAGLIMSGVVYVVVVIAGFSHVRQLALRIPDDQLASQTETVRRGFASAIVLTYTWLILRFAEATVQHLPAGDGQVAGTSVRISFRDDWAGSWAWLLGLVACPAQLIFAVWAIVLVVRYRSALAKVAKETRSAQA